MRTKCFVLWILTATCLLLPESAWTQSEWLELGSEHFLLYTDTDVRKGTRLLSDLEARYTAFSEVFFPVEARQFRIKVLLVDDRREFEDLAPDDLKTRDKSAYFVQGSGGTFLLARDRGPDDIADDVGHSLGHLLLSRSAMWQPFWLQEGAGEYVRRLGQGAGADAVSPDDGFPLADLLAIVPPRAYDDLEEGGEFRTQAYHLVRIFVNDHPEEFRSYLNSLKEESGADARPEVDAALIEEKIFRYRDSALTFSPLSLEPAPRALSADEADAVRGDLALSGDLESLARTFYEDNPVEQARLGLGLLGTLRSQPAAVRRAFGRLVEVFPDSGLAHYRLGALPHETDEQLAAQIVTLERAVELMPRMGRALGELGWLYALDGRPEEAIEVVKQAIGLEPESADRFYEILAQSWMRLGDYDRARECIQIAVWLPHSDASSAEHYSRLAPDFYRELDLYRRDREAERVEELRRRVEELAEKLDPRPPVPVPAEPAPIGSVSYSVSSGAVSGVTAPTILEAPTPEYSADLRRAGVEGRVVLEIDVDRRGRITDLRVRSSDDSQLTTVSLDAVNRWVFDPARRGIESTTYSFRLTLSFRLE